MWPWCPYGDDGPTLAELAVQACSSTDRGYDLLAPRFDHTPFRTSNAVVERALGVLGDARFERGIDVCCGTGAALALLSSRCECVVGIDRSTGMLAEARARVPNAHLVRADALEPPFRGAFDIAVSFGAFGHILVDDEPRFVAAIRDLLAPGGRFIFVTADPPPLLSRRRLAAHAFNAAMCLRNAVRKPPFVMYYLTFLLPRARRLLVDSGFEVRERREAVAPPYVVVEALRA